MGCDIHLHAEFKVNGKWLHYASPDVPRHYLLFGLMADVRNRDRSVEPICTPRGMPADASDTTRFACEEIGEGGHSHSWLSSDEIVRVVEYAEAQGWKDRRKTHPFSWESDTFGYFFGNYYSGWKRYPTDNERLRKMGVEDVRWIFWFDN